MWATDARGGEIVLVEDHWFNCRLRTNVPEVIFINLKAVARSPQ